MHDLNEYVTNAHFNGNSKQNPLYHNVRKKPTTATITVNIPYICIIVCLSINLSTIKTVLWYISFMFQIDEFHNYFQMFDIHTITDTTDLRI